MPFKPTTFQALLPEAHLHLLAAFTEFIVSESLSNTLQLQEKLPVCHFNHYCSFKAYLVARFWVNHTGIPALPVKHLCLKERNRRFSNYFLKRPQV